MCKKSIRLQIIVYRMETIFVHRHFKLKYISINHLNKERKHDYIEYTLNVPY